MKPITKTTIVDQVIKDFMSAIKQGKWKPGEKLPGEIELAQKLQISRTSVREALRVLSYFNVIVSKPGFGTILAPNALRLIHNTELVLLLSEDQEMEELWEVRFFLEPQIAYWATIRATREDILELDATLEGAKSLEELEIKTVEEKLAISRAFHKKLGQICRNKLIVRIMDSIQDEIDSQRMEWESQWHPEVLDRSLLEHMDILACIRKKQPEKARGMMLKHMLQGITVFEKAPREDLVQEEGITDFEMSPKWKGN